MARPNAAALVPAGMLLTRSSPGEESLLHAPPAFVDGKHVPDGWLYGSSVRGARS